MELRHLRYFLAVAEELNVTRAAQRIGIAQPPLTQQIKALEAELGVELFHRVGRRIELSSAGTAFLEEARAILDRVAHATARAQRAGRGETGKLRVGFTSSASFSPFVTEVLKTFRAAWPEVEVALEEHRTSVLTEAVKADRLDAAFVRPPLVDEALTVRWLATEPMVAAVPIAHPVAGRRCARRTELRGDPLILYPRRGGSGLSDQAVAECLRLGFAPRPGQEAPELAAAINFVAAGMGVAVVPACMRHLRPDAVRFLTLAGSDLRAELGLAQRSADRSETVRNLFGVAEKLSASHPSVTRVRTPTARTAGTARRSAGSRSGRDASR